LANLRNHSPIRQKVVSGNIGEMVRSYSKTGKIGASKPKSKEKAIKQAFQNQIDGKNGTNFVEVVSNCPSGWKMTPVQANEWMEENMFPFYPLGDMKVDGKLVKKD